MKSIIVPTDFSENARIALNYAIYLFSEHECNIYLVHAIPSLPYPSEMIPKLIATIKEEITKNLADEIALLEKKYRFEQLTFQRIVDHGSLREIIMKTEKTVGANIIIMGTQGIGRSRNIPFGSNAISIIQSASCPVLTVPEVATLAIPREIVFAIDYQDMSDIHLIAPLRQLAEKFDAHISVVSILTGDKGQPEDFEVCKNTLDEHLKGVNHSFSFLKNKNVIEGIFEFMHERNGDMLVMMPKHQTMVEAFLSGSNTNAMALYSDIPLLSLPVIKTSGKPDKIIIKTTALL